MKFYVDSKTKSLMKFDTKEEFLRSLSLIIDDCVAKGGFQFQATIDTDVDYNSTYYEEEFDDEKAPELTSELKDEIMQIVAMAFETGYFGYDSIELSSTVVPMYPNATEKELKTLLMLATDYYVELLNMGPAGFYEEFKDKYDFDTAFAAEYGEMDSEEE